jgi:RNA polymerase sigma-70 factor (ECF subfamily)
MPAKTRGRTAAAEEALVADELLVQRVLAGEETAFEQLYARYLPRIYRFVARRLDNRADTEETVQQVFLNVFASMHSFRGEAPFAAWLFGLTRRTLASRFKKKLLPTVPLDEESTGCHSLPSHTRREPSPHEMYEYRERFARLERSMSQALSAEQRRLFELHHVQHRSIREISRLLRKTEDAVKSHLYRARKVLLAS